MQALNALPAEAFVAQLQGIFEHSPWVAERVAGLRPFATREQLHQAMCAAVDAATSAQQLALIRAHPKLGARGAVRAALTQASATEQRRAGLTDCTPEELERLEALNTAYGNKFGFPFIIAVRGHDPTSILAAMERRLGHTAEAERQTALQQIGLIAGYRLAELIA